MKRSQGKYGETWQNGKERTEILQTEILQSYLKTVPLYLHTHFLSLSFSFSPLTSGFPFLKLWINNTQKCTAKWEERKHVKLILNTLLINFIFYWTDRYNPFLPLSTLHFPKNRNKKRREYNEQSKRQSCMEQISKIVPKNIAAQFSSYWTKPYTPFFPLSTLDI